MSGIQDAINLIKQGRKKEAQPILTELIRSNTHDLKAWFWYVETLETVETRLQLLEACLNQNPGDPKVLQALDILRKKKTLNPPSMPLNPPSKPIQPPSQPPTAQSATPTSPRSDYYSPFPLKYEYQDEEPGNSSGLPDPAGSFTDSMHWQESAPIHEADIPNIHIPMNDNVLAYLKSVAPYLSEIQRMSTGAINDDRTHSDYSEIFVRKATGLPESSRYIIYGFAALVHPRTGIIFGYAMGMGNKYRLPEMLAREYDQYLDVIKAQYRKNKNRSKQNGYTPPPLEDNWANSMDFSVNLIRKCYDYYGVYPNTNAVIHFNREDDIEKLPAPKPQARWDYFVHRFTLPAILLLICLVFAAFLYVSVNGITLPFTLNSILDWILMRR